MRNRFHDYKKFGLIFGFFVLGAILLVSTALQNADRINPDGVSYILIARHYAEGKYDLAISSYWGPLLSWLMVPLLWLGLEPLLAARLVTAISGLVYLLGCVAVFKSLKLDGWRLVLAAIISGLFAIVWSVEVITPDLLFSGLVCFAVSRTLSPFWLERGRTGFLTGIIFGLAYLAKAVALPLSILLIAASAALSILLRGERFTKVVRRAIPVMLGIVVVAGPWIAVLSWHYERLVFSDTGWIAHAISGPASAGTDPAHFKARHPLFTTFHVPEAGRLTSWENPVAMPYRNWSPFDDRAKFVHQLLVIKDSLLATRDTLSHFDALGLGLATAILAFFLLGPPWPQSLAEAPWRAALLPIVCIVSLYLPSLARGEARYFLACYPFLLSSAIGMFLPKTEPSAGSNPMRALAAIVILISFVSPLLSPLRSAFEGQPNPLLVTARAYAQKVEKLGIAGSVAAVDCCGALAPLALYTSYLLGKPFYGAQERVAGVGEVKSSGAQLVYVPRFSQIDRSISADPDFTFIESSEGGVDGVGIILYQQVHRDPAWNTVIQPK